MSGIINKFRHSGSHNTVSSGTPLYGSGGIPATGYNTMSSSSSLGSVEANPISAAPITERTVVGYAL